MRISNVKTNGCGNLLFYRRLANLCEELSFLLQTITESIKRITELRGTPIVTDADEMDPIQYIFIVVCWYLGMLAERNVNEENQELHTIIFNGKSFCRNPEFRNYQQFKNSIFQKSDNNEFEKIEQKFFAHKRSRSSIKNTGERAIFKIEPQQNDSIQE